MPDLIGSLIGGVGLGGGGIGAAVVRLRLDADDYQRQLATAKAETTAGANAMGSSMDKFGGLAKAAALGAGVAVVAFGAVAIKAASDLGEAINKNDVIFGKNAAEIEEWAKTGAEAFGLSQTAALDAAASFGQIIQNAGLTVPASAEMSKALVQLAGDMASFNNEDPTDMLERIRSGLAGEVEPLRRFGVDLSAATVEAKAMELGLAGANGEIDAGAKIQARYAILLEQTNKQQGDFARTADSLPNQLRTMNAEFTNLAAKIGTSLLPAVTSFMDLARELVTALAPALEQVFGDIATVAGDVANVITAVRKAVDELLPSLENLNIAGEDSAGWMDRLRGAGLELLKTLFPGGQQIGDAAEQLVELSNAAEAGTRTLGELEAGTGDFVGSSIVFARAMEENFIGSLRTAGEEADDTRQRVVRFAHMTGDELEDWETDVKAAFDTYVLALEESEDAQADTQRGFSAAVSDMLQDARALSRAMKEIELLPDEFDSFVAFLSDQGPEWLIGFAELSEKQQRRAQDAWEASVKKTDAAKESLDRITGALNTLGRGKSKHEVIIEYKYVGFDPSKPGMAGVQRSQ